MLCAANSQKDVDHCVAVQTLLATTKALQAGRPHYNYDPMKSDEAQQGQCCAVDAERLSVTHLEEGCLGGVHSGGTGLNHHIVGGGETHTGGCSNLVLVDLHLERKSQGVLRTRAGPTRWVGKHLQRDIMTEGDRPEVKPLFWLSLQSTNCQARFQGSE